MVCGLSGVVFQDAGESSVKSRFYFTDSPCANLRFYKVRDSRAHREMEDAIARDNLNLELRLLPVSFTTDLSFVMVYWCFCGSRVHFCSPSFLAGDGAQGLEVTRSLKSLTTRCE